MAGLQSSNPLSIFLKFHIWRLNVSSRCSLSPINNISSPFQFTLQSKYLRFSQFSLLSSQLSHLSLLSSQISFLNFPGKCWKWGHWGFSLSQLSVWFCWSSLISDELTTFLLLLHLLLPAMVITPKHCPFIFTFSFSVTQLPLFSIVKVLNLCFFFYLKRRHCGWSRNCLHSHAGGSGNHIHAPLIRVLFQPLLFWEYFLWIFWIFLLIF